MAKGKEAAKSANARYEAALAHIDRLTSEVVKLKALTKEAEQRAIRLEGAERQVHVMASKNDEELQKALRACAKWRRVALEDYERRKKGLKELFTTLLDDLDVPFHREVPFADRADFMRQRYPAILAALCAGEWSNAPSRVSSSPHRHVEARLSPEALRRFQRLIGERAVMPGSDADMDEVWNNLLDARQVEFTPEERCEYVLGQ